MERNCQSIQSVLRAHEKRRLALQRLEEDAQMFTKGKVSAMKAKFNERRNRNANSSKCERSDGVTDDDDDVAY